MCVGGRKSAGLLLLVERFVGVVVSRWGFVIVFRCGSLIFDGEDARGGGIAVGSGIPMCDAVVGLAGRGRPPVALWNVLTVLLLLVVPGLALGTLFVVSFSASGKLIVRDCDDWKESCKHGGTHLASLFTA